jgi:hypothetical protein
LESFPPNTGGAARHLNEILRHQKAADTDDPTRAVRMVAQEYVGYFRAAAKDTADLGLFDRDLHEQDNPRLTLASAFGVENPGIAGLVRFIDLRKKVTGRSTEVDIDPLRTDYTFQPSAETLDYVASRARELKIGAIRPVAEGAFTDQNNRRIYWHGKLSESRRHNLARPIVNAVIATS